MSKDMKMGIGLYLHVIGFPAQVSGIYNTENGILLQGNISLDSGKEFREILEEIMEKGGLTVSLDFLPSIKIVGISLNYCQKPEAIAFGITLRNNDSELGQIQAVLQNQMKNYIIYLKVKEALHFSAIPVIGDWISNGYFGPLNLSVSDDGGVNLSIAYSFLSTEDTIELSLDQKRKENFLQPDDEGKPVDISWKPVAKSLGCVTLLAVGGAFSDGHLYVMLQAELHISILTITLEGLGISVPFSDLKNIRPLLTGLGIGMKTGGIEVYGSFAKELNKPSYSGQLIIQVRKFGFTLQGAYEHTAYTSIFAVGILKMQFGGTGCIKIKKIAVGFGYNRLLPVPSIDQLGQFSLIQMMRGEISASQAAAVMKASEGQHWIAAGMEFESYGMIQGDVAVSVLFGTVLRVDLQGKAVLDLSLSGNFLLAHVVLLIQASFDPQNGVIAIYAMLGGESYLLSKDCHVTGGFACCIWYDKEHKGDFVITLGGYHRDYKKPGHYPSVAPLGLKWQITKELLLQGSIYFALTPAQLMAGGAMMMAFDAGCIKAWCSAQIDIFIQWQPFFYDFLIDVSLGISVKLLFIKMKLEIGCSFHLWGPEFSGIAKIKLWFISFQIKFISNNPGSAAKINWNDFKKSYLKAESTSSKSKDNVEFRGCEIQICGGLIREENRNEKEAVSLVSVEDLMILISSSVPFTEYQINQGQAVVPKNQNQIGLYPCKIETIQSTLSISIEKVKSADDKMQDGIQEDLLQWKIGEGQVPCALWGSRVYQDSRGNWLTETLCANMEIFLQIRNEKYKEYDVSLFLKMNESEHGEKIEVPAIESGSYDQNATYDEITRIQEEDVMSQRMNVLEELGFSKTVISAIAFSDVWNQSGQMEDLFPEKPYLAPLGGKNK